MTRYTRLRFASFVLAAIAVAGASRSANAGGVIGDFFREVGNATGITQIGNLGDQLDRSHREIKTNIRVYGELEGTASAAVHQVTSEAAVEIFGPILAGLIQAGKADAQRGELLPLPPHVKERMSSYFGPQILDKVRYRVGGGELTLQAGSVKYGTADAITLDDIIVFRSSELVENLHLVAHELGHVVQYHEWGITDFAKRYVRSHHAVEGAAERIANDWQAGKSSLVEVTVTQGVSGSETPTSPTIYQEPCMTDRNVHCF